MNVIRENTCRHDIEKNANVPRGLNFKHSNLSENKEQHFHKLTTNGNLAALDNNSCHQNSIDQKPPLLDIPSPDVIQKRLLQLSAAFSRTQLSTLFDFSCLNNGRNNFEVGHRFSTYSASTTTSRLSVFSETNSHQSNFVSQLG